MEFFDYVLTYFLYLFRCYLVLAIQTMECLGYAVISQKSWTSRHICHVHRQVDWIYLDMRHTFDQIRIILLDEQPNHLEQIVFSFVSVTTSGVPQGSNRGHLLFRLIINELFEVAVYI